MIVYIQLISGLAFLGRVKRRDEDVLILDNCMQVHNVTIPAPTPQGIRIMTQPALLPVNHMVAGPVDDFAVAEELIFKEMEGDLQHPLVAQYVKATSRIELAT